MDFLYYLYNHFSLFLTVQAALHYGRCQGLNKNTLEAIKYLIYSLPIIRKYVNWMFEFYRNRKSKEIHLVKISDTSSYCSRIKKERLSEVKYENGELIYAENEYKAIEIYKKIKRYKETKNKKIRICSSCAGKLFAD